MQRVRIGLTGGIGSGKSTVARIFESFGVPVYYADTEAKRLMHESPIRQQIIGRFGEESYVNGDLNRSYLAKKVFKDPKALQDLNNIVHPIVGKDYAEWCLRQTENIVVKEAAILIESGAIDSVDKVVVVTAPEEIRIDRVMKRDGVAEDEVRARMKNQIKEEDRLKYADFIVLNDGNNHLIEQVKRILISLNYLK
ncbi:MAG: dephospho-CoA kinase [Flavobacteriales bacterium]|nr:dephospho-CoA kinase [Flavobacteriales bacterium]